MLKNLGGVAVLWMLLGSSCLSGGCAGKDATFDQRQQMFQTTMAALEAARFKGSVELDTGGSLLSAGAKTVFHLGPENTILSVDGEVDFTEAPRPATGTPADPTKTPG